MIKFIHKRSEGGGILRHQQIKRIVDGSNTAILFIHGIIGTPDQFNDLIPFVRKDISIYNILLDGHGKGVRDFASTSMNTKDSAYAFDTVSSFSIKKKMRW